MAFARFSCSNQNAMLLRIIGPSALAWQVSATINMVTSGGVTYGGGIEQTLSLTSAQVAGISAEIKALIKFNGPTNAPTGAPSSRAPTTGRPSSARGRRLLQTRGVDYTYCCNPIPGPNNPCNTTEVLNQCLDVAAGMVQLAFHDAGTYVKSTGQGGPDGCINLGLAENAGLRCAQSSKKPPHLANPSQW